MFPSLTGRPSPQISLHHLLPRWPAEEQGEEDLWRVGVTQEIYHLHVGTVHCIIVWLALIQNHRCYGDNSCNWAVNRFQCMSTVRQWKQCCGLEKCGEFKTFIIWEIIRMVFFPDDYTHSGLTQYQELETAEWNSAINHSHIYTFKPVERFSVWKSHISKSVSCCQSNQLSAKEKNSNYVSVAQTVTWSVTTHAQFGLTFMFSDCAAAGVIRTWGQHVCEVLLADWWSSSRFRASLYPCPETPLERKEMLAGVNSRIDDLQMVRFPLSLRPIAGTHSKYSVIV